MFIFQSLVESVLCRRFGLLESKCFIHVIFFDTIRNHSVSLLLHALLFPTYPACLINVVLIVRHRFSGNVSLLFLILDPSFCLSSRRRFPCPHTYFPVCPKNRTFIVRTIRVINDEHVLTEQVLEPSNVFLNCLPHWSDLGRTQCPFSLFISGNSSFKISIHKNHRSFIS